MQPRTRRTYTSSAVRPDRRRRPPCARSSAWGRRGCGSRGGHRIRDRSTFQNRRPDAAMPLPAPPPEGTGRCCRRSTPAPRQQFQCDAGSECSDSSPRPVPAQRARSGRRRTSNRRSLRDPPLRFSLAGWSRASASREDQEPIFRYRRLPPNGAPRCFAEAALRVTRRSASRT
jgi:hypothetical protein